MAQPRDTGGSTAPVASMDIESHEQASSLVSPELDDALLPKLPGIIPAIFVPVGIDYTDHFNPPKNGTERAKMALESVEFHRNGGLKGIKHLTELERRRITAQARKWEVEHGTDDTQHSRAQPREVDDIIRSMTALPTPGEDYNMPNEGVPPPNFLAPIDMPNAADSLRQLHRLAEDSLRNQRGYVEYMDTIKAHWTEVLKMEEKAMKTQTNNPAEDVEMT